jgi:hypothetical protein
VFSAAVPFNVCSKFLIYFVSQTDNIAAAGGGDDVTLVVPRAHCGLNCTTL